MTRFPCGISSGPVPVEQPNPSRDIGTSSQTLLMACLLRRPEPRRPVAEQLGDAQLHMLGPSVRSQGNWANASVGQRRRAMSTIARTRRTTVGTDSPGSENLPRWCCRLSPRFISHEHAPCKAPHFS